MTGELEHLWTLHTLDEEALRLRAALERYPAERAAAERSVADERATLEARRQHQTAVQKERRELERQAEAIAGQERTFQNQLPQVKKNEEYQALLHEIEGAKAKRSELETQILMKLEEEETVEAERPRLESALKALEADVSSRLAALAEAEARERADLDAIEARRAVHIAALGTATRSRYERTLVSRQGRAVVPIMKNACGGCFRNQAPQVLQEARRGDRLITCDGCGRLLVWPPDA